MVQIDLCQLTWKEHIAKRKFLYSLIMSWALVGALLPGIPAVIYVSLTYIAILRTRDLTGMLLSIITILIFSDSRAPIFAFAASAKVAMVILTLLFIISNYQELEVKRNDIFRYFLPFILFSILATFWSTDAFTAIQKSISYGAIFFLIPIIYLNGKKVDSKIGTELVYLFTMMLTIGLVIHLFNPSFTSLAGRYRGLLGNPNGLGIFLSLILAVYYSIYSAQLGRNFGTGFRFLFFSVFFISLFLAGSRTAIVAILLFFLFNQVRNLPKLGSLLLFIVLIISYDYLILQLPNFAIFLGIEEYLRVDTLAEGSGRYVAWTLAWERIQDFFFVGGGFGNTEFVFKSMSNELSLLGHQGNAHNSYLTIWMDTGLIGIVLFGIGLFRSIMLGVKNSIIALPIIYSILFSTFFESWLAGSLNPITSLFLIVLVQLSGSDPNELEKLR